MRFCHITTFYPPQNFGGDGILVQQICEGLAARGHQVDVVHCADAYELKGAKNIPLPVDPPNIRRHTLRSGVGLLSPLITQQTGLPGFKQRKLESILSEPYDVVHFHNVSLVGGPGILRLSMAPVTLYSAHDHWLVCPTHVLWKYRRRPCDRPQCLRCSLISGIPPQLWRYSGFTDRCLEHVDSLLAPSEFTAAKHREAGISCPIQVLNSYSRLDVANQPGPEADEDWNQHRPANEPLFVYAGRIEAAKGLAHMLEAFRQRPNYVLLLAGSGTLSDQLKKEYSDCTNIHFLGPLSQANLASLFHAAVAVVSPAWGAEAFPLVNIEAMSCGAPVIGRRSGGSAEAIDRTGGGLVYQEPDELLPLLDRLAGDAALRAVLAEKALTGYQEHYSEARWMVQYFELIERIAASKPA